MKHFLLAAAVYSFSIGVNAQLFEEGANFFHAGVGVGSPYTYTGSTLGVPPLHASFEHGFSDRFGGGASIGYTSSKYEQTYLTTRYAWNFSYLTLGARGAYHLLNDDNIDVYLGAMLGYNISSAKFESNDPSLESFVVKPSVGGIALGGFVGSRYKMGESSALFAEVGYNIAWVSIGYCHLFTQKPRNKAAHRSVRIREPQETPTAEPRMATVPAQANEEQTADETVMEVEATPAVEVPVTNMDSTISTVRKPGLRATIGLAGVMALTPEYRSDPAVAFKGGILFPIVGPLDLMMMGSYFGIGERYSRPHSNLVPDSKWLTGILGLKVYGGGREHDISGVLRSPRRGVTFAAGVGLARVTHDSKYYEMPSEWTPSQYIPVESMIEHDIRFTQDALIYHLGWGWQFTDRLSLTAEFNITDNVITLPITLTTPNGVSPTTYPRFESFGALTIEYTLGQVK